MLESRSDDPEVRREIDQVTKGFRRGYRKNARQFGKKNLQNDKENN